LVSVSMVSGVCSLSARSAGSAKRVATRLIACYLITTAVAVALGRVGTPGCQIGYMDHHTGCHQLVF
jgi:Na+/H+-dicarboxylate symporter